MRVQTVFLAGHAKLPSGSAAKAAYDMLALTVEIEPKYGVILHADCTLVTRQARDFVCALLRGYSLKDGVEPILREIGKSYHGSARSALIAAVKDLQTEFQRYLDT
jgi:hypothetical protein